jgi:ribulose-phosphate 3-epimerase
LESHHLHRARLTIRKSCNNSSASLYQHYPESAIEYVLDRLDLILIMTVNPGFGGQAFIPAMVDKVKRVKAMIGDRPIHIQIDGGVTPQTAPLVAAAGANVLVAGAAIFQGDSVEAYHKTISAIRDAADAAA